MESPSGSRLKVHKNDGVTHVEFLDRNILDEANIAQIGEEVLELVESEREPKILIRFANVDHLSSAALGTLITIHNRVKGAGGQLKLAEIDPQIYEVFSITKLTMLFDIHDSAEDAESSFV